jgi:F420-dependent oxidoreductase-like protein
MRIGLSGGAGSVDKMIEQAQRAEADGFTSLWYAGAVAGDPLVAMAFAGRATATIELGTSVLPTYPVHPLAQANRVAATVMAMGRTGFTLGIGPSHAPVVEGVLGMSYDTPGRHVEEYVEVLQPLLAGEQVDHHGEEYRVSTMGRAQAPVHPVPLLIAALGSRLLRVAGERADGTVLWMANARAVGSHVAPRITEAADAAGRAAPRIVAGLPVAVHDDVDEARATAAEVFEVYGTLPNYQRILARGGISSPAAAAIVGDEAAVATQIEALFAAGATDVWAAAFPVGDDRSGSRNRTRALLKELAAA